MADSLRVAAALVAAEQRDQRDIAAFHLEQGRQLFAQERDDDAIAELRRAIFLAPYESEAHLLLGRIYLRTGRMQDAIDALTIAVWSDPANTEASELLGEPSVIGCPTFSPLPISTVLNCAHTECQTKSFTRFS